MHGSNQSVEIRRLYSGDEVVARELFAMMVAVFDEDTGGKALALDRVRDLLARHDFYAVGAFQGSTPVGGITGHVLPMTRDCSAELFIYDLAVRADWQRKGVGRALVKAMTEMAAEEGIATSFVAADNEDADALSFYRAVGGDGAPVTMFAFSNVRRAATVSGDAL
jgi:aminoglycoside 3-N-acetyltransferase I